jgi:acyl transferase domain-containing protein
MEPMLEEFEKFLSEIPLATPNSKYTIISNLTGKVVENNEIILPSYWKNHTRHAVEFAQGIKTVFTLLQHAVAVEQLVVQQDDAFAHE